jgi:NAD(P)H-flavin reductase
VSESSVATGQSAGGGFGADPAAAAQIGPWSAADLVKEIRETFALVEPNGVPAAAYFYEHFFTANPRYRKYFSGDPQDQDRRLFLAVQRIVADLDRPGDFLPYLQRLALRHRKFGLRAAHYEAFGASLLATMGRFCGERWDEQAAAAWQAGYGLVAEVMLDAAAEADASGPPVWEAEVVQHELLAADIAKVVLRPLPTSGRPVPYVFRAGQYAAVEVSSLGRVWRDFSFANTPAAQNAEDGASGGADVEIHVRSGRAGGVSETLVQRTEVGHRLRIAAAEGELAFPPKDRVQRLILVGHGTGAAPVRALLEAAISGGDKRPMSILLVSDAGRHYLSAEFAELAGRRTTITLEEVEGDPLEAVRSMAAAEYARGGSYGAVLVGAGELVEQCRLILTEAGVDPEDISSDLFD